MLLTTHTHTHTYTHAHTHSQLGHSSAHLWSWHSRGSGDWLGIKSHLELQDTVSKEQKVRRLSAYMWVFEALDPSLNLNLYSPPPPQYTAPEEYTWGWRDSSVVRALAALTKDLTLTPSTHMIVHSQSTPFSGFCRHQTYIRLIYIHAGKHWYT